MYIVYIAIEIFRNNIAILVRSGQIRFRLLCWILDVVGHKDESIHRQIKCMNLNVPEIVGLSHSSERVIGLLCTASESEHTFLGNFCLPFRNFVYN